MFEDLEALPLLVLALVHGEEEGHDAEAAQQEGAGPQTQTVAASSHLGVNFFWSSLVSFASFRRDLGLVSCPLLSSLLFQRESQLEGVGGGWLLVTKAKQASLRLLLSTQLSLDAEELSGTLKIGLNIVR